MTTVEEECRRIRLEVEEECIHLLREEQEEEEEDEDNSGRVFHSEVKEKKYSCILCP